MKCCSLDTCEGRARLYLSETSTSAALRLLPSEVPIEITDFVAIGPTPDQWRFLADLPPLPTAGALADFLDGHESIEPIDVTVRIGADVELSTHDDGEATFLVPSHQAALQLLGRAVSPQELPVLTIALQSHPGSYVLLREGRLRIFPTFDDYLRGV